MLRPRSRLMFCVLAALLVSGACGGDNEADDNATGDGVGTSSSTSALLNPDGSPAVPTNPDGTPTGSGATGGTTRDGKPVAPERNDIPLAGRYTYDYTANGGSPKERLLDVYDSDSRSGDVRQGMYFGSGTTVTATIVVWLGTDSFYVEAEQRADGNNQSARCEWNPGFVELDLPLAVGKTWRSESQCSNDAGTRRRTLQAKVTGTETVNIGGQPVRVWVIERTTDTHTEARGTNVTVVTDERRVAVDRFSVDRHLLVQASGTESSSLNGVPQGNVQFVLTMRSITPSPVPKG